MMAVAAENMVNAQLEQWLGGFGQALSGGKIDAVVKMFDEDCYWRDFLTFTWNLDTCEGKKDIAAMLESTLAKTKPGKLEGQTLLKETMGNPSRCNVRFLGMIEG